MALSWPSVGEYDLPPLQGGVVGGLPCKRKKVRRSRRRVQRTMVVVLPDEKEGCSCEWKEFFYERRSCLLYEKKR